MTENIAFAGNWNEQKGKLKKQYTVLTDKDLTYEIGKKNEMFEKIQAILGKTRDELQKIIAAL